MSALTGKVVAMLCAGSAADRAIAVALAEAGADIAIGTLAPTKEQEFATASIANELWAIGSEQFNTVLDPLDPTAAAAFAAEVCDRLGRCDALVVLPASPAPATLDELSLDEWEPALAAGLTLPFIVCQAFERVIERGGGGTLVVAPPAELGLPGSVVAAGLDALATEAAATWEPRGVRFVVVEPEAGAVIGALATGGA